MTRFTRFSLLLVLLAAPSLRVVQAQATIAPAAPTLVVAARNTTAEAETTRPARSTVLPNDRLAYTLTFTNPTGRTLKSVELKNPIPAGVHLVAGSTHASRADARVEFSADGGKSWSAQPMERVMVDGAAAMRPVPAARYTHVRWTVDGSVAPKATVTADFEARVGGA